MKNKQVQVRSNTEKTLGSGGYGSVFEGVVLVDTQVIPCAIKYVLKIENAQNEAQVLINTLHPLEKMPEHLVTVYAVGKGDDGASSLIVMERLELSLHDMLHKHEEKHISMNWTKYERELIMIKCFMAVMELHSLELVHRDVKPANIIMNREASVVKLGDFGSLKRSEHSTMQEYGNFGGGSCAYIAPERLGAAGMTMEQWKASDVYSVGVVICEVYTGAMPFGEVQSDLIYHRSINKDQKPFHLKRIDDKYMVGMLESFFCSHADSRRSHAIEKVLLLHDYNTCCLKAIRILYDIKVEDKSIGISLLERASTHCNIAAALLCYYYRMGKFVPKNESNGEKYEDEMINGCVRYPSVLTLLFDTFCEESTIIRGMSYQYGWNNEKNIEQALYVLKQFSKNPFALYQLGLLFLKSNDRVEASTCFSHAADYDFGAAMCKLGDLNLKSNQDLAIKWYYKAKSLGCEKIKFVGTALELSKCDSTVFTSISLSAYLSMTLASLCECKPLLELTLSGTLIDINIFELLCNVLRVSSHLRALNLKNLQKGLSFAAMFEILTACTELHTLDLSYIVIIENDWSAMSAMFNSRKKLAMLNLKKTTLSNTGLSENIISVPELCKLLPEWKQLRALYLRSIKLGVTGCKELCKVLLYCKQLMDLDLYGNDIFDDGAIALSNVVKTCENLQVLHVNNNSITDTGASTLCLALANCMRLQQLTLNASLSAETQEWIQESLPFCRKVSFLMASPKKS